jgi:hypothetical protein
MSAPLRALNAVISCIPYMDLPSGYDVEGMTVDTLTLETNVCFMWPRGIYLYEFQSDDAEIRRAADRYDIELKKKLLQVMYGSYAAYASFYNNRCAFCVQVVKKNGITIVGKEDAVVSG